MLSHRHLFLSALLLGSLGLGQSAFAADPLIPGGVYNPIPDKSFFGGNQTVTSTITFTATSGSQMITGTFTSAVFDPDNNPLTDGFDFYYQIHLDGASTSTMDQVNINGFLGANIYDTGQIQNASFGPFASSAETARTLSRSNGGGAVRIEFASPGFASTLDPGETSPIFVLRVSNGQYSDAGNASITGTNGVAANGMGIVYTPVPADAAAPEPGSLALLALGGSVAAVRFRRRRRA